MATYRTIRMSFWNDPAIESLPPADKLLYLYLFTCPHANNLGVLSVSLRKMAFETGLSEGAIRRGLAAFESSGRIVRDGGGGRGGINMKQYGGKCPGIVIGGDAGNFLGEYMAGGIIVLMGRAGDHLASGMHGGVIYLRREYAPAVVPDGLDAGELTDDASATLGALLARYDACFGTEPHEQASVDEFVALRPASSRPYAAMYAS